MNMNRATPVKGFVWKYIRDGRMIAGRVHPCIFANKA